MNGRVAIVCEAPVERFSWEARVWNGLLARGVDAHLVVARANLARWQPPRDFAGDRFHVCPTHGRDAVRALGPRAALHNTTAGRLKLALARLRPRLAHFAGPDLAMEASLPAGCSLVVSLGPQHVCVTGIGEEDYFGPLWEKAAAVHLPDRAVEARALRRGMPKEVERAVIAPGVLMDHVPRVPQNGHLRALSIDDLNWTQGLEHSIQAISLVPGCEYRIAGEGAHLSALAFARHQLGVTDRVQLDSSGNPSSLLAAADVLVSAQVIDGLNPSVPLALAAGVPVVMTQPGEAESLPDDAAVVVPRRDPQALAAALRELSADPGRRQAMSEAGRRVAAERFDADREVEELIALYERFI